MQQAIDIISNQLRGKDRIQALKQLGKIHEECMTTNKYGPNVLIDLLQLTEFLINGVVPCFNRPEPNETVKEVNAKVTLDLSRISAVISFAESIKHLIPEENTSNFLIILKEFAKININHEIKEGE